MTRAMDHDRSAAHMEVAPVRPALMLPLILAAIGMAVAATGAPFPGRPALGPKEASMAQTPDTSKLPRGAEPLPVKAPHFPSAAHAVIWRNWMLVPISRIAATVGATPAEVRRMGRAMGLAGPPAVTSDQQRRSYITVIRRNWHLLPYEQLLQLLGWTQEHLSFTLREDDFLYIKLGSSKPRCAPVQWRATTPEVRRAEAAMAETVRRWFPRGVGAPEDPLFAFVGRLAGKTAEAPAATDRMPRYCYSYFAPYGDPLLDSQCDPYPEGYLKKLASAGVTGVWLQGVLRKLAPFPWDAQESEHWQERLEGLKRLVKRAHRHGIGVYLYMNEPRAMPEGFFETHKELRGVSGGDHATLCVSAEPVSRYITDSIATICRAAPELAGIFTITASENLTNCWSHGGGAACPRCSKLGPAPVIASVAQAVAKGIGAAGTKTKLISWDWGWPEDKCAEITRLLPEGCAQMSVSEWSMPIVRGGVASEVGEYSLGVVGPGPRARRNWAEARGRGLDVFAKIQAANSWEMSAVPYTPTVRTAARHAASLVQSGVGGIMLGWTLGGYPSPNLRAVALASAYAREPGVTADAAADRAIGEVAAERFGPRLAEAGAAAWAAASDAMAQFPFHIGTAYSGPQHGGPANLLWLERTGYAATMVGFAYDDLTSWRSIYPPEVFAHQMELAAEGFAKGSASLRAATQEPGLNPKHLAAALDEAQIMEACSLHLRSSANQARFVMARDAANAGGSGAAQARAAMRSLLEAERDLAIRLAKLQGLDSRLGFEASNHYYYVGTDLAEKVLNCEELLERLAP